MSAPEKINRMEPFQLAKKVTCLAKAEGRALLAIADACSMRDCECRKSYSTLAREYKDSVRQIKYGIHGRDREDGTPYFPGLLRRGVITVKSSGDGVPTTYEINLAVLRALVLGEKNSAQSNAQNSDDQCTYQPEPVHNVKESSAQLTEKQCTNALKVLEQFRRNSSERESSPDEKANPSLSQTTPAAASSLKGKSGGQENDVSRIRAACFEITRKTPAEAHVQKILNRFPDDGLDGGIAKEIISTFKWYHGQLSKRDQLFAEKTFFADGGGIEVILSERQREWKEYIEDWSKDKFDTAEEDGYSVEAFLQRCPPPMGAAHSAEIIEAARKVRKETIDKYLSENPDVILPETLTEISNN
jgi:hypothetical protein